MTVRHVVLLTWHPGTSAEQRRAVEEGLRALPALIPEIQRYDIHLDAGYADGNADLAVVAEFGDRDAWSIYTDHPEHRAVITDLIRPILASRTAIQTELP